MPKKLDVLQFKGDSNRTKGKTKTIDLGSEGALLKTIQKKRPEQTGR